MENGASVLPLTSQQFYYSECRGKKEANKKTFQGRMRHRKDKGQGSRSGGGSGGEEKSRKAEKKIKMSTQVSGVTNPHPHPSKKQVQGSEGIYPAFV